MELNIRQITSLNYYPSPIIHISLSPNNNYCAVVRNDGNIQVYLVKSWTEILFIPGIKLLKIVKLAWVIFQNASNNKENLDDDLNKFFLCASTRNGQLLIYEIRLKKIIVY